MEVWVAETWHAHGEDHRVQGVYDSREAAWDGLKGEVETLYADERGWLRGKPRDEERPVRLWERRPWPVWAVAKPMPVQGRKQPADGGAAT